MKEKNNLGRLLLLLILTTIACLLMYNLPNTICGYKLQKVDLLSDIRIKKQSIVLDSLRHRYEEIDSIFIDSIKVFPDISFEGDSLLGKDSINIKYQRDSAFAIKRDSLYKEMQQHWNNGDSSSTRIEDFSVGHKALHHFYSALGKAKQLNRPVRIAFLGDSFIEGDIIVGDLRRGLQRKFGGKGVGFVPIASNVSAFRSTVKHTFNGWKTLSILKDTSERYTLSNLLFESEEVSNITLDTQAQYSIDNHVNSAKLLYQYNESTAVQIVINSEDTFHTLLPATQTIKQIEWNDSIRKISFDFKQALGFKALGVVLEDSAGITVDNYSLRGSSGINLAQLDEEQCVQFQEIRPYDLIILQYGLNVANAESLQYTWYRNRMIEIIRRLRTLFPETDILLLGVSDRSYQEEGEYVTMPAVLALMHEQRQIAKRTGISFWNMFKAMGGEKSMIRYVENNWASKDYTHLSFRGGKEIANSLLNALLLEKEFYDQAGKNEK